jgi:hypothetical protein
MELSLFTIDRVGDPSLLDDIEIPMKPLDITTAQQLKPQVATIKHVESKKELQKRKMLEKRDEKTDLKKRKMNEDDKGIIMEVPF